MVVNFDVVGSTVVDFIVVVIFVDFIFSVVVTGESSRVVLLTTVDFMGCDGVVRTLDVVLDSVKT